MSGTARTQVLSTEAKRKFYRVSTASITTQLLKRGFRNTFIRNLKCSRPDLRMVGYAFTLRYAPTREDMPLEFDNDTDIQRIAVERIEDEEVLVIDARGELKSASFGEIIATRISRRGAAGLVTDGALRDTPGFANLNIPAYFQGVHATASSVMHYPVDMNVPIGCGGVLVMPGDVIVGDAEGVVVIPAKVAEEVAHDTYEQELLEEFIFEKVRQGSSIRGVYPPDNETLEEYQQWRDSRNDI